MCTLGFVNAYRVRMMAKYLEVAWSIVSFISAQGVHAWFCNCTAVDILQDLHLTAYSPLGTPDSADEMNNTDRPKVMDDPVVKEVAKKYNKNPGQVLIRWAVQNGTSVLPKSKNPERIESNLHVFDWSLDAEDFKKLSSINDQVMNSHSKLMSLNECTRYLLLMSHLSGEERHICGTLWRSIQGKKMRDHLYVFQGTRVF